MQWFNVFSNTVFGTDNFFTMEKNVSTTTTIAEALLPNVMDT